MGTLPMVIFSALSLMSVAPGRRIRERTALRSSSGTTIGTKHTLTKAKATDGVNAGTGGENQDSAAWKSCWFSHFFQTLCGKCRRSKHLVQLVAQQSRQPFEFEARAP